MRWEGVGGRDGRVGVRERELGSMCKIRKKSGVRIKQQVHFNICTVIALHFCLEIHEQTQVYSASQMPTLMPFYFHCHPSPSSKKLLELTVLCLARLLSVIPWQGPPKGTCKDQNKKTPNK